MRKSQIEGVPSKLLWKEYQTWSRCRLDARRCCRTLLDLMAIAMSGQAGSKLAGGMGIVVRADTLLRRAKRAGSVSLTTPRVLGVVDFAFQRGRTYGTILDEDREPPTS